MTNNSSANLGNTMSVNLWKRNAVMILHKFVEPVNYGFHEFTQIMLKLNLCKFKKFLLGEAVLQGKILFFNAIFCVIKSHKLPIIEGSKKGNTPVEVHPCKISGNYGASILPLEFVGGF